MKSLHAILPELGIFPVFRPIGGHENGHSHRSIKLNPDEAIAAKVEAAHAAGVAKGAEEACMARAVEIADLKAARSGELESARKKWVKEESSQLADLITATLAEREAHIGQSLQSVMLPFLEKVIPLAALDEFSTMLESALRDDFKGPLHLSGPDDLVAAIKTSLASRNIDVICETLPASELMARSDNFTVTTRLKRWIDGIQGIGHE